MRSAILLVLVILAGACAWDRPIPQTSTPDYPCGPDGVVCTDPSGKPTGMCCDQYETCGGGFPAVGCPAGACCNLGSDLAGDSRPHAQRTGATK